MTMSTKERYYKQKFIMQHMLAIQLVANNMFFVAPSSHVQLEVFE